MRATLSPELEPSATRCLPRSSQPGVCLLTFAELTFVRVQWHDLEQMQVRHCARLPLPALPAARPCAEIYLDTWRWAPVRNSVSVSPITGLSDNNLWPFSLVGHVGGRLRQSVDDEHHVRFGRSWLGNAAPADQMRAGIWPAAGPRRQPDVDALAALAAQPGRVHAPATPLSGRCGG